MHHFLPVLRVSIDKDDYPFAMRRPSGFVEPCLPSKVVRPPSGSLWLHEIGLIATG